MFKNYIFITALLFACLASCTDKQNKLEVTGAKVSSTSENEIIDSDNSNTSDSDLEISDDLEIKKRSPSDYLIEELVEVGDRVFFDYDKSRFKDEGVETLKRQATFLLKNPDLTVTVEGHCDQRGTREYNLALGERRAYSVKSFLVTLGVKDDRISVISYGKERPQTEGDNEQAWARSRTAITVINP